MSEGEKRTERRLCVYEAPRGRAPPDGRDCSDEMLPPDEWISDEERERLGRERLFVADWSLGETTGTPARDRVRRRRPVP